MSAGIKPLTTWITREITAVKPGRTPDICPACAPPKAARRGPQYYDRLELPILRKERYGKDYVVRCCPRCGRCFYYDNQNKRFIELSFSFECFFDSTNSKGVIA
jgi:hypothetical protein